MGCHYLKKYLLKLTIYHVSFSLTRERAILMKNNFWQRISRLSQRWRTQRIAIRSVNCRISWIIESLNAHCAFWHSGKHACLSIIIYSLSSLGLFLFGGLINVRRKRTWIWFPYLWKWVRKGSGMDGSFLFWYSLGQIIHADWWNEVIELRRDQMEHCYSSRSVFTDCAGRWHCFICFYYGSLSFVNSFLSINWLFLLENRKRWPMNITTLTRWHCFLLNTPF